MDSQTPHILETELLNAERVELLNELDKLFQEEPISREVWAFFWVSDIDKLKEIVSKLRTEPNLAAHYEMSVEETMIVKHWAQKSRQASALSTPASSQTPLPAGSPANRPGGLKRKPGDETIKGRSKTEADKCRKRDGEECVITKAGTPIEIAHIFPFSMRHLQSPEELVRRYNFWKTLRLFWPEEKVNAWFQAIGATTETTRNLLSFAPHTHSYHGRAYFGLKPVEMNEDQTQLTLQFYWLPWASKPQRVRLTTRPDVPSIRDGREVGSERSGKVKLFDVYSNKPIFSGDVIVMKTADPEEWPLPDLALLEMQWVLNVVAAISAGSEPVDLDSSDYDSPDMSMAYTFEDLSESSLSPPRCLKSPKLESEHLDSTVQQPLITPYY
ncbi:hypothetical protein MferCBS31731_007575 [Microsporum ferrugineum]